MNMNAQIHDLCRCNLKEYQQKHTRTKQTNIEIKVDNLIGHRDKIYTQKKTELKPTRQRHLSDQFI